MNLTGGVFAADTMEEVAALHRIGGNAIVALFVFGRIVGNTAMKSKELNKKERIGAHPICSFWPYRKSRKHAGSEHRVNG